MAFCKVGKKGGPTDKVASLRALEDSLEAWLLLGFIPALLQEKKS